MRPWTHAEEEALRVLAPLGGPALACAFDRSLRSIYNRAWRLGIRLGDRSCEKNLRTSSPAVMRKIKELSQASLCPSCAKRPIGVKRTGLCGVCHLEALTAIHEEEIVKADKQRALWAARSKLQRRRRSLEAVES
jgi:hypothetical protein